MVLLHCCSLDYSPNTLALMRDLPYIGEAQCAKRLRAFEKKRYAENPALLDRLPMRKSIAIRLTYNRAVDVVSLEKSLLRARKKAHGNVPSPLLNNDHSCAKDVEMKEQELPVKKETVALPTSTGNTFGEEVKDGCEQVNAIHLRCVVTLADWDMDKAG